MKSLREIPQRELFAGACEVEECGLYIQFKIQDVALQ